MSKDLACLRLSDLNYQSSPDVMKASTPYFYEKEAFSSPVKALAWCPSHEGLLATGGGVGDQIIRIFDMKNRGRNLQHTIKCNTPITSLCWRKGRIRSTKEQVIEDISLAFCEELVSTHGDPDCELKLW